MTKRHLNEPDYLLTALWPLRQEEPVRLVLQKMKMHGKVERLVQQGLLLVSGKVYGLDDRAVVVSLLGSGSCVIFPTAQNSKSELVKAGIPAALAQALIDKLIVIGDTENATTHSTYTSSRRYRSRRP
jgi:hypothetical protein